MGEVVREGNSVIRMSGDWTPAVHRLLQCLNDAGMRGIPRPLGRAEDGREILSFVEGTVPAYPMPGWVWADSALESCARLLRQVHDATADFDLGGPWRSPTREPVEVICHNDFAPYNLVFEGATVVGVIDWDFASPGPRLWDLAYLAYRIVPLSTTEWGDGFTEAVRRNRLHRLLAAYGMDAHVEQVIATLRQRLLDLATFTDHSARRLHNPELGDHARLYRHDAEHLPTT